MSPLIRNVVFDAGGVLLQWDPPAFIAKLHPDAETQALIRREIFEHADWLEFDRGTYNVDQAAEMFGERVGLGADAMRKLFMTANESLRPIPGTIQLLEDLARAGIHLFLLSNMPVSTFEFLVKRHAFF